MSEILIIRIISGIVLVGLGIGAYYLIRKSKNQKPKQETGTSKIEPVPNFQEEKAEEVEPIEYIHDDTQLSENSKKEEGLGSTTELDSGQIVETSPSISEEKKE